MSRRVLLFLLVGLLAAAPAAAQNPVDGSASLTLSGVPERVVANGTQHSQEIGVTLQVGQGTCVGGSQDITVTVAAEAQGATVEVQPRTFSVAIGSTDTAQSGATFERKATVIVNGGVVTSETEVPVNVTATTSDITCSVAVFGSVPAATASGSYVAEFYPIAGIQTTTNTDEPVPGFELPLLLAAVGALLVLRRRKD